MRLDEIITIENPKTGSDHKHSKLVLTAGVHGDEIGTILILTAIARTLLEASKDPVHFPYPDWDMIKFNTIQIIPCVNVSGMQNGRRAMSTECDITDLNRCWNPPITTRDTINTAINSMMDPIKKGESIIFVDMHCSPTIEPMFLINADQPSAGRITHWGDMSGLKVVVRDGPPDTLKMRYDGGDIIALTWEQEGMSKSSCIDNTYVVLWVQRWLNHIIPALYDLQSAEPLPEYDAELGRYREKPITATMSGLWVPFVKTGSYVDKDAVLGCITDMNGVQHLVYNEACPGECSIIFTARYVTEHSYLCFISKHIEQSFTKHE